LEQNKVDHANPNELKQKDNFNVEKHIDSFWCWKTPILMLKRDSSSIMVNKHAYKPLSKTSWTSTMRCSVGRIMQTKQTFSTVPRTRTQMRELDLEEVGCWVRRSELCVREKPVCHLSRLQSLSFIKISSYVCMKLSVEVRNTQVSGYFINVECQWGLEKLMINCTWVLLKFDEDYDPPLYSQAWVLVLTSMSTPKPLYSSI
jgi:hypothetical protein